MTEALNLSTQAISDFMKEGNRHLFVPAMAENTSRIIENQQEQIEEQAKSQWNRMYPKVEIEKEKEKDPFEELEERKHGLSN